MFSNCTPQNTSNAENLNRRVRGGAVDTALHGRPEVSPGPLWSNVPLTPRYLTACHSVSLMRWWDPDPRAVSFGFMCFLQRHC
ncbi:unnamed protein product [Gadus morhua 'NCC']